MGYSLLLSNPVPSGSWLRDGTALKKFVPVQGLLSSNRKEGRRSSAIFKRIVFILATQKEQNRSASEENFSPYSVRSGAWFVEPYSHKAREGNS
jgi:hypothetical protein